MALPSTGRARSLRAVVVDADRRVRESLAGLLEAGETLEVVGFAADAAAAVELCAVADPDVVVLGPRKADAADGRGLITAIRRCCPGTSVLTLAWTDAAGQPELQAGKDSFVIRSADASDLLSQIASISPRYRPGES